MRYAHHLLLSTRRAMAMLLVRWFYQSPSFLRVLSTLLVGLGIHGFYKAQAAVKAGLSFLVEAHPAGWILATVVSLVGLVLLVRGIWAMSCAVGNATERVSPKEAMHLKGLLDNHGIRSLSLSSGWFHAWEATLLRAALASEASSRALAARLDAKLPDVAVSIPRPRF